GTQMAIVTVQSLDGESVENYAVDLFKQLGVGSKKNNRGGLRVLHPHQRKYLVEVVYGREPVINDARAGDAGRAMVPYLRQRDYGKAAEVGAWQLAKYIADDAGVTLSGQPPAPRNQHGGRNVGFPAFWVPLVFLAFVLFFFLVLGCLAKRGGSSGSGCLWFLLGMLVNIVGNGSGGGRGGGSSW